MANEMSQDDYQKLVFEEGGQLVVNMADVEEAKFENVPKGTYNAEVSECEFKQSKNSGAPMFELKLRITDGDYEGRTFFNYVSFSPKAIAISKSTLLRLNPEIFSGAFKPQEVAEQGTLIGAKCRIKIVHEDYEGEPRAKIGKIEAAAADAFAG
jgi:hypothetical protein